MNRLAIAALRSLLATSVRAEAAAIWPTGYWQPLSVGGGVYADTVGDESPVSTDLVGGNDGSGTYTAGYWLESEVDDQLSLRMRLNADGAGSNNVWQFLVDSDADTSTVEWVLEVSQSGAPSSLELILTPTLTAGPAFGDLLLSETYA